MGSYGYVNIKLSGYYDTKSLLPFQTCKQSRYRKSSTSIRSRQIPEFITYMWDMFGKSLLHWSDIKNKCFNRYTVIILSIQNSSEQCGHSYIPYTSKGGPMLTRLKTKHCLVPPLKCRVYKNAHTVRGYFVH